MRRMIGMGAALALSGCAAMPPVCLPPARSMVSVEMLFGRNIGDRVGVSDAAFAAFTAREITPRFPDGLSVIDAAGQWRDGARGTLVREPSKLVLIVFADDADKRASLEAVAAAYKRDFRQQSVMTTVRSACVTF